MNQGVEILLARMDSNPEEFVGMEWPNQSKWDWVMREVHGRIYPDPDRASAPLRFLTDAEVQALWDKLESLRADEFTKSVMRTLLAEEPELSSSYSRELMDKKPTKLVVGRSQYEALKKEYAGVFPSIEDAAYQQIVDDLNALEASKKRRKK